MKDYSVKVKKKKKEIDYESGFFMSHSTGTILLAYPPSERPSENSFAGIVIDPGTSGDSIGKRMEVWRKNAFKKVKGKIIIKEE